MKRPLCLMAILLTAAVYLYLEFFSSVNEGINKPDHAGESISVVGRVMSKEFKKSFSGEYLPVIYIIPIGEANKGPWQVQCYLSSSDRGLPSIGQTVEVSGKVSVFPSPTNPGEFDSRLYYSTLKIAYRLNDAVIQRQDEREDSYRESLFKLRIFFEGALDKCLDEEDSSVMKAMLLGDKAFMDEEIKDMYKSSGIMHILAVSGLHISVIGMGIYELLRRLNWSVMGALDRVTGAESRLMLKIETVVPSVTAAAFMYSYGEMCGMGSSSFRAICMFALRIAAPVFGRTYDILSALALSEILLLLDQPLYLFNSGFLFSFAAVIGVAVISPVLGVPSVTEYLIDRGLLDPGQFGDSSIRRMRFVDDTITPVQKGLSKIILGLRSGASIMLATLPVYGLYYYTYPVHSLLLNLFVIPLMGGLMVMGIAAMSAGSLSVLVSAFMGIAEISGFLENFSRFIGLPVHIILKFYRLLCSSTFLTRKMTWYMGHANKWQVFAYLILLAGFVLISRKKSFFIGKMNPEPAKLLILFAAVFILSFHISPQLEIDMIDVGQGDGIVISCGGKNVLIDGGSSSKKNVGKYQIVPFLKYKGIGTLDAVILTHEDEDHLSGIRDIFDDMEKGGISVGKLILPEVDPSCRGENYRELEARAKELKVPSLYINTGESFGIGEAEFTCINPALNMMVQGPNEYSTVLFMKYGRFTALFTGDVEGEGLENVKKQLKEVLKKGSYRSGVGGSGATDEAIENSFDITLLKVAHHGSRYTTDEEFLKLIKPQIALISCGRDNSYGHPHEELLQRLEAVGSRVYRTDNSGAITVEIRNEKVRIYEYAEG